MFSLCYEFMLTNNIFKLTEDEMIKFIGSLLRVGG